MIPAEGFGNFAGVLGDVLAQAFVIEHFLKLDGECIRVAFWEEQAGEVFDDVFFQEADFGGDGWDAAGHGLKCGKRCCFGQAGHDKDVHGLKVGDYMLNKTSYFGVLCFAEFSQLAASAAADDEKKYSVFFT